MSPKPFRSASKSSTAQQGAQVRFVGGGTTLIDLMKLNVEQPETVIDINSLPLNQVEALPDGGLKIGAVVRNSDLAYHPTLSATILFLRRLCFPELQRNCATWQPPVAICCNGQDASTSGTQLCLVIRESRAPAVPLLAGFNRTLAILGTSEQCIATNPSDMNVALTALEAIIHIQGPKGERSVPIDEFFLLPGDTPHRENVLEPGELITFVTLPATRRKQIRLSEVARQGLL